MTNIQKFYQKDHVKKILICILLTVILLVTIAIIPKIFATLQPIRRVEIFSEKSNYQNNEPSSWKISKSARFIGIDRAQISIDVETISKKKTIGSDIILVMDTSASMTDYKMRKSVNDALELVDYVLDNENNNLALITFDSTSLIRNDFTNNKSLLENEIRNLQFYNQTNYSEALRSVGTLLENYQEIENRDCTVLFLTGSYPSVNTPSELGYFNYLKSSYPFITVNAIQYGMGKEVVDEVKRVSDYQYVVNNELDDNYLLTAAGITEVYENFEINENIDTEYFSIENIDSIEINQGNVSFDKESQGIKWKISNLKTGSNLKMLILINLKSQYIREAGYYPTSKSIEIVSKMGEVIEKVQSSKTPILSNNYKVTYDINAPDGCVIENISNTNEHFVFDEITTTDEISACGYYQFKGWEITNTDVEHIDKSYFIMPEEDVILKAKWGKIKLEKSMDGKVNEIIRSMLQRVPDNYNEKLWEYKNEITKVVIQGNIETPKGAIREWDISREEDGSVKGYIVPNDTTSTTYTAYIQGTDKVILNENSSFLFKDFINLKSIEGLNFFDTSRAKTMNSMFAECKSIESLDLSTFDTRNNTTMLNMFQNCNKLTYLDVSSFNTSNVEEMSFAFQNCANLKSIDVSSFDTSKSFSIAYMFDGCINLEQVNTSSFNTSTVNTMAGMFRGCQKLTYVDTSKFDTSNVNNMNDMFSGCISLKNLDVSNFDTGNVIIMAWMFANCSSLTELEVGSFNTKNVDNMAGMFSGCTNISLLNVKSFDTTNVTTMAYMFNACNKLTNLDLSSFVTPQVTTMEAMFSGCNSLATINLSNFNTSNVTSMRYMFGSCQNLKGVNVSNFNTSKVTDMSYMFYDCGITSINVSNFNTSLVTNMSFMFQSCWYVMSITQNFNTSNVTDMNSMFGGCQRLAALDVSNFRTSKVVNMTSMFEDCPQLTSMNFANFDTSKVTKMDKMFKNCWRLVGTFTIRNSSTTYSNMLYKTSANTPAQLVLNYTSTTSNLVNSMIASKSSDANVSKGALVT